MIENLDDAPLHIRAALLEEFNHYAKEGDNFKPPAEIEKILHECSGYMLQMFWQGRFDKMSNQKKLAMHWLTENCIREDLKATYVMPKSHEVSFKGENHRELSREVIDKLLQLYKNTPEVEYPQEKKSFFKKWFS